MEKVVEVFSSVFLALELEFEFFSASAPFCWFFCAVEDLLPTVPVLLVRPAARNVTVSRRLRDNHIYQ